MRYFSPAKNILFSGLYVIVLVAFLWLLNLLLFFVLNHFVLDLLNWFNSFNIIIMIIFFLLFISAVIGLIFNVVAIIAAMISSFVFRYFPYNTFTIIASMILCIGNAIYDIILLWKTPNTYSFLIVVELLILSGIIWSLNTLALAREPKKYWNKCIWKYGLLFL